MVSNLECQVISWENCMLQLEEGHAAPWLAPIVSVILNVQFGELLLVIRADMQCNHFPWWTEITKLHLNVFITQFIKCSYHFKFDLFMPARISDGHTLFFHGTCTSGVLDILHCIQVLQSRWIVHLCVWVCVRMCVCPTLIRNKWWERQLNDIASLFCLI